MVKVLVGQRKGEQFPGFWAEFEGEKVSSYKDTRGEKNIVYTLYRCTAYQWEAYRVHIADESNPDAPVYELLPFSEDPSIQGVGPDYSEPYVKEQLADKWPLFLKDMDYFRTRAIDPRPSNWSRQLQAAQIIEGAIEETDEVNLYMFREAVLKLLLAEMVPYTKLIED